MPFLLMKLCLMLRLFILLGLCLIVSCTSNTELISNIDNDIEREMIKIEKLTKESEIDNMKLEYLSLELEAAKLKSNLSDRSKAADEITQEVKEILKRNQLRTEQVNTSKSVIDSLLKKKDLLID